MSYTDEERRQLSMFGVRKTPSGEWKPILERAETNRCTECKGFGTYGNPLCGAVYNCERCKGTGYDPEGKGKSRQDEETCDPKSKPLPTSPSLRSFMSWLKRILNISDSGKGT